MSQHYHEAADLPPALIVPPDYGEGKLLTSWIARERGASVRLRVSTRGENAALYRLAVRNAEEKLALMAVK